jgi:hypothetical protein
MRMLMNKLNFQQQHQLVNEITLANAATGNSIQLFLQQVEIQMLELH